MAVKVFPSDKGLGRNEFDHIWLIKMGHVLVWSIFKIFINKGERCLPSILIEEWASQGSRLTT